MALYDNRTFKAADGKWWVAEVHGGAGAGRGPVVHLHSEIVYLTCLSDDAAKSRITSIRGGTLRRLPHKSLLDRLEEASVTTYRMELSPSNAPDPAALAHLRSEEDDEGLAWVWRDTTIISYSREAPHPRPAIELICLEDSALQGAIAVDSEDTRATLRESASPEIIRSLIAALKKTLVDSDAQDGEQG
jgi:hypothetical protein